MREVDMPLCNVILVNHGASSRGQVLFVRLHQGIEKTNEFDTTRRLLLSQPTLSERLFRKISNAVPTHETNSNGQASMCGGLEVESCGNKKQDGPQKEEEDVSRAAHGCTL